MPRDPHFPDPDSLPPHRSALYEEFETKGEIYVREAALSGRYAGIKLTFANAWIAAIDASRQAEIDAAEREIERSISRDANNIARGASRRATYANIISALAFAVAAWAAWRSG